MTEPANALLKKTPLDTAHRALGARMVPFGGWDMPVEYAGITAEHLAVRTNAGLFDVSHMGEIEVAGTDALQAIQHLCTNDASRLAIGQAHYSALTTPAGTFVDDILVYRLADAHFLLVVNASNIAKDHAWITANVTHLSDVAVVNSSSRYALMALQGPAALEILRPLTGIDVAAMRYYRFEHGEVAGVMGTVSRTGYTGEDGFEIFVPPRAAANVWNAVLDAGRSVELKPAGLGARDTLRLEAAMRLYGNDIDDTTTVLEAGLGWVVGWKKPAFIGHEALRAQREQGVNRTLAGFELRDPGIARRGYPVFVDGQSYGTVRSGTQTPSLKRSIGLAYLPLDRSQPDTEFEVGLRGRRARARVVSLPFYQRPKG
jgi:aminomethyltransferase